MYKNDENMKVIEGKVLNNSVNIHYLMTDISSNESPLIIIPGLTEAAEDYIDIITEFQDRMNIVISLRGKEGSILSEELIKDYKEAIKQVKIVVFNESNHNLFNHNPDQFINTIKNI